MTPSMQSIALCQRLLNVEQRDGLVVDGIHGAKTDAAIKYVNRREVPDVLAEYAKVKTDGNGDPDWYDKARKYGIAFDSVHGVPGVAGDFVPIGVCNHHTAGAVRETADLRVSREGREGVPGPLYNFLVGQSGDVHFITNGRTHNAGKVDSGVVRSIRDGISPNRTPGRGDISGNTLFYGVAMDHSGKEHQPVSGVAKAKMAALNRMFCDAWRWDAAFACNGHKELTSRKPDPIFDMAAFRARVAHSPGRPLPESTVAPFLPLAQQFACPHCDKLIFATKGET